MFCKLKPEHQEKLAPALKKFKEKIAIEHAQAGPLPLRKPGSMAPDQLRQRKKRKDPRVSKTKTPPKKLSKPAQTRSQVLPPGQPESRMML
jgi:hypothetical protein